MQINAHTVVQRLRSCPASILILVAGLVLTALACWKVQQHDQGTLLRKANRDAVGHRRTLEEGLNAYLRLTQHLVGFMAAAGNPSRHDFNRYFSTMNVLESYPGGWSTGYIQYVPQSQRRQFEADLKVDYPGNNLQFNPQRKEDLYVVRHRYPDDAANKDIIGRDISDIAARRLAMEKARDSGKIVVTPKHHMLSDKTRAPAVIYFAPVYGNGLPTDTVAHRRAALKGFVFFGFRVADTVQQITGNTFPENFDLEIYDGQVGESTILYDSDNRPHILEKDAHLIALHSNTSVAGRQWQLYFYPTPEYLSLHRPDNHWLVLLIGLLGSLLCAYAVERRADRRRNEQRLYESRQMLQLVIDNIPERVFWKDRDLRFLGGNQKFAEDASMPHPQSLVGLNDYHMPYSREEAELYRNDDLATMRSGIPRLNYEERQTRADGSTYWVSTSRVPLRAIDGKIIGILGTYEDITERKETEQQLLKLQRQLIKAQQISNLGYWEWNLQTDEFDWSEESYRIFGLTQESMPKTKADFLEKLHPEDRSAIERAIGETIEEGAPYVVEPRILRPDGLVRYIYCEAEVERDAQGGALRFMGVMLDITQRKQMEEKLRQMAQYDSLTGLPNRNLFHERLTEAGKRANRNRTQVALLYLDLDRFKEINDTLGHDAGDETLRLTAQRIRNCLRESDTIARLGGDEFAIILEDLDDKAYSPLIAQKILDQFATPVVLHGMEFFPTPSIGIALYPDDCGNVDLLPQKADIAMYEAKRAGRANYQLFNPRLNEKSLRSVTLKGDIRHALERGEFELFYQPQVSAQTRQVTGAEALLRWHSPRFGLVEPTTFIPLLEETGQILPVGQWVIEEAIRQCKHWQDQGLPPITLSVNLSARQLRQADLVPWLRSTLQIWGVDPRYLGLEITETSFIENLEASRKIFEEIKRMGVTLALDDFGTGYSALNYLNHLPLDTIKLDHSFTAKGQTEGSGRQLVAAVIDLAHRIDLEIVAEGIESWQQYQILSELGCDLIQGYYFGKPMCAANFERHLAASRQVA